jgi:hypothetical protein
MRTVKMIACDSGVEQEFTPEHAQNIINYQVENHVPDFLSWKITDPDWEFKSGKLSLKKTQSNGDKSDTGIGDKAPKSKRDRTGIDSQP